MFKSLHRGRGGIHSTSDRFILNGLLDSPVCMKPPKHLYRKERRRDAVLKLNTSLYRLKDALAWNVSLFRSFKMVGRQE